MSDSKSASVATTFVPFNNLSIDSKNFIIGRAQTLSEFPKAKLESDLKVAVSTYKPSKFSWGDYNDLLAAPSCRNCK